MEAFDIIRLIGGEFSEVPDEKLKLWIEICRPMVSRKQFGNLYEQALAFMVCHRMKLAGYGENPLGPLGSIGIGFALGSVSEGGSSVSFGAGQSSNITPNAELGLTVYGTQFLQLRRMCVVPIHISWEAADDVPVRRKKPAGTTKPGTNGSGTNGSGTNSSGTNGPGPSWHDIEDPDAKNGLGWHDMNGNTGL